MKNFSQASIHIMEADGMQTYLGVLGSAVIEVESGVIFVSDVTAAEKIVELLEAWMREKNLIDRADVAVATDPLVRTDHTCSPHDHPCPVCHPPFKATHEACCPF